MTLRTESDVVFAANCAIDLTNLVIAYLEIYRQHSKNVPNALHIPTEPYTVVFRPMSSEAHLSVVLVYTKTVTWDEPRHYDIDSDYFNESIGASNVSHYVTRSETKIDELSLKIPFQCLLQSKEQMEQGVIAAFAKLKADAAEDEKQKRVQQLEAELRQLKGGAV